MEAHAPRVDASAGAKPGLTALVRIARSLAHFFLLTGIVGVLVSLNSRSAVPLLICGGGFILSYFTWVLLVLFGFMNFSLSAMLWFVLGLGACIGLLMSGEGGLIALGCLGLLVMVFATVIPVSRYDPTTPKEKRERKGMSAIVLLLVLPFMCLIFLMFGSILAVVGGAGLALLTVGVMIPHGPHGPPPNGGHTSGS